MDIYIGAENLITPLGANTEENFQEICKGNSAIKKHYYPSKEKDLYLAKFEDSFNKNNLLLDCILKLPIDDNILTSDKTKYIISSTKGYIDNSPFDQALVQLIAEIKKISNTSPIIISNACISGVLGIAKGADMIKNNQYDNVIVVGIDFVSDFVVNGFEALYALELNGICKPFDENRKGINLGEACAAVVLSKNETIFYDKPLKYISGSSSNDANHISGPSRNGEGLFRSITKTLEAGNVKPTDIDYISAHGTGTVFNDNMESIAFKRLGLNITPVNSLKGYFGHTLGTAGILETIISMQQLRNQKLIKSFGYDACGTDEELTIITTTKEANINLFLKTASGFGGGNASILISNN